MEIGHHIMAWRRFRGFTQEEASRKAGLSRPYLSRLERGEVDPTLSSLRRLAVALQVGLGQLLEDFPPAKSYDRFTLDRLARGALHLREGDISSDPDARALARIVKTRRRALGLYKSRGAPPRPDFSGKHAMRWLRARLGEEQWNALLGRIDKLAGSHAR